MLQTNSHRCLLFFCIASSVSMSGSNKLERFLYNFLGWKQQQPVHRPQDLTTTTKCFIWNSTLRQQQQRRIRQQKITIFQTKKNKRRTKTNRVITLRFSLIQEVFQSGKVHSFRTVGWASRTMLWFRREVKIMCLTMPSNSSTNSSPDSSDPASSSTSSNRPPTTSNLPPAPSSTEEVEAASDEVKVYDEEEDDDDRVANPNEKYRQVDILSAIKSSLITDTEQVRSKIQSS